MAIGDTWFARILTVAAAVYTAGVLGALTARSWQPATVAMGDGRVSDVHVIEKPRRPVVGFSINLHYTEQIEIYLKSIDDLKAMGIHSVQILTPAFQRDGAAQSVGIEVGPGRGPKREHLVRLLRHAKSRQMTTALMPIVLFTNPRGNEWRGKIEPEDWPTWWESYRLVMDYFLGIANEADVDMLAVGSELLSTQRQVAPWEKLIGHMRKQYQGLLYYSTNWDNYTAVPFWRSVDLIGINGYWDLTAGADSDEPGEAQLAARWREIRRGVLAYGQSQGRPILLTEIGYPCLPWGLAKPWNYVPDDEATASPGVQAKGYASFLSAWGNDLTGDGDETGQPVVGVFFYEWAPWREGGLSDLSMDIRKKPALKLIQKWLADKNADND